MIAEISNIRATLDQHIPTITALVEKHDVALYGRDGNNGLRTTVSKHKTYWQASFWLIGVLLIAGIGAVAAKAFG